MAVVHEGSHTFSQMYSEWQDAGITMYPVPTAAGYVVVTVTEGYTHMRCVRNGQMYWRSVDRAYTTKVGITRTVNQWMRDLEEVRGDTGSGLQSE